MHVRWIPTLFFAAAATPAFAQSPNVLTAKPENDVVFARKLYELGQTDMAVYGADDAIVPETTGDHAGDDAVTRPMPAA